ncbi:amidohydrolase family protein [Sphingomonas sp. ID0503]|uniref:amidohydrolase family protein n=1 Tax=Sphingomonas sp. ID0503 TaxID=3399691 RepID=UPI003AFB2285
MKKIAILPGTGRGTMRSMVEGASRTHTGSLAERPLHRLRRFPSPFRGGLLTLAALLSTPALAETVAFTGGTIAIGDGSQPIQNGTVVIANGRVVAAGAGVAVPAGARVVDATGKWVSPGIVTANTDIGIADAYGIQETNDARAKDSPFSAALDLSTAINESGPAIANDRMTGVTRAFVVPVAGSTIFGGQGAVIDLGADLDPVTRPRAFQYVELGEDSTDRAGSRPAAQAMIRAALNAARDPAQATLVTKDAIITKQDAAALRPVVEGRMPLFVHANRVADIRAALALKAEFPAVKMVLVGAAEGWRMAPQIAAANVPVIATALADLPSKFEQLSATQSNVGRLVQAGVTVAISTVDGSEGPYNSYLTQYAGNLVALTKVPGASGLNWGAAFATITSKPAQTIGMDGEIGSLRPGRRADVVVWDGDPLELSSEAVAVYIDGIAQPMTSRQTRLRQRYLDPREGSLPKAYQH